MTGHHSAQGMRKGWDVRPIIPAKKDAEDLMRQHWDERATADAFHYVASWRPCWSPEDFFRSGEDDYVNLVEPILTRLGVDPEGRVALDLGCGAGRLTRAFATRFRAVYAIDVSPEMLRLGFDFNEGFRNIFWIRGPGTNLSMLRSCMMDFAFSYLMLQHSPQTETALNLIGEILRLLKPGGIFLFQFNSSNAPTMNWKGRALWSSIDRLRDAGREMVVRRLARAAGVDLLKAGSTWRGSVLEVKAVLQRVWTAGAAVAGIEEWGTGMTWCYGWRHVSC